jgi:hypothetical protein
MARRRPNEEEEEEAPLLEGVDASLLDIVDHVLTKGIVITGDLVLGVADIDLIYLRLSAVLCAADRILPNYRAKAAVGTGAASSRRARSKQSTKSMASKMTSPLAKK